MNYNSSPSSEPRQPNQKKEKPKAIKILIWLYMINSIYMSVLIILYLSIITFFSLSTLIIPLVGGVLAVSFFYVAEEGIPKGKSWSRPFAIILATISLILIPIGTITGIIMFVYLSKEEVKGYFKEKSSHKPVSQPQQNQSFQEPPVESSNQQSQQQVSIPPTQQKTQEVQQQQRPQQTSRSSTRQIPQQSQKQPKQQSSVPPPTKQSSQQSEGQPPQQQTQQSPPPPPPKNCPSCNAEMRYVEEHDSWWCDSCQEYK